MDDDWMEEIIERVSNRLTENLRTGNLKDEKLRAGIASTVAPWVRARKIDGMTPDDAADARRLADNDDLLMRRTYDQLEEAYPRLLGQAIQDELDELVARGELVAEVDADGEIEYRRPEDR